jgi:hypothetical protein
MVAEASTTDEKMFCFTAVFWRHAVGAFSFNRAVTAVCLSRFAACLRADIFTRGVIVEDLWDILFAADVL